MTETILKLVHDYGYFVLIGFNSVERLGIPLPAGIATTFAYAFSFMGRLNLIIVLLISTAIPLIFSLISYNIGRKHKVKAIDSRKMNKLKNFYEHHAGITIILSQLQAPARSYIGFLAGDTNYDLKKYIIASLIGVGVGILEGTFYGMIISKNFNNLNTTLSNLSRIGPIVILAFIAVYIINKKHILTKFFHYIHHKEHRLVVWLRHEGNIL